MLSHRLKELRVNQNLTQSDVAVALGFTSQAIANYEKGKREPRIQELITLANFFNVSIDYLVGRTNKH